MYVSDLDRAMETARIAFEGTEIPIILDSRLRECNYGELNGMPAERVTAERAQHIDAPWPGGESYRQVVERTGQLLADLVRQWDGSRVLLIGHSANKWALDHLLLGEPLPELVAEGLTWRPGWEYVMPTGFTI